VKAIGKRLSNDHLWAIVWILCFYILAAAFLIWLTFVTDDYDQMFPVYALLSSGGG